MTYFKELEIEQLPLAGILLSVKGAIKNLQEALSSNNNKLIFQRRVELSELVLEWQVLFEAPLPKNSILSRKVICNLKINFKRASSLLIESSQFLTSQIS